jgi:DNA-binding CsgD family transcriptional regulator
MSIQAAVLVASTSGSGATDTVAGATDLATDSLRIGTALAELHERVQAIAFGGFRAWALRWLADQCGATSGVWEIGSLAEGSAHCTVSVGPEVRRGLSRVLTDRASALRTTITIAGHSGASGFSSIDAARFEVLAQHVAIAWRMCQQLDLLRRSGAGLGRSAAFVDSRGYVHAADRQFFSVLRQCWPEWTGPRMPDAVCALLAGDSGLLAIGVYQWTSTPAERELRYLQVAPLGPLARLTARERAIALAIAAGGTYRDCAARFGISTNTLRNTVVRVYRKLGVATKLELAELVRAIPADNVP